MQNSFSKSGPLIEKPPKHLFGAVVLSSKNNKVSLPRYPDHHFQPHVEGSPNGRVFLTADFCTEAFQPTRHRQYVVHSTEDLGSDSTRLVESYLTTSGEEALRVRASTFKLDERGPLAFCIEQTRPFGITTVFSNDLDIHFLGIYSEKKEWLVWSNSPDYEEIIRKEDPSRSLWIYRFRPRSNFGVSLPTKRICARWFRWSETELLADPAKRFQALENSLFNS